MKVSVAMEALTSTVVCVCVCERESVCVCVCETVCVCVYSVFISKSGESCCHTQWARPSDSN